MRKGKPTPRQHRAAEEAQLRETLQNQGYRVEVYRLWNSFDVIHAAIVTGKFPLRRTNALYATDADPEFIAQLIDRAWDDAIANAQKGGILPSKEPEK